MGVGTADGKGSKEIGRLLKTSGCEYLLFACSPQLGGEKRTWGKDRGWEGYGVAGSSPIWGEETPLPPGSVAWIPSGAWVVAGITCVSPPLQIHSHVPAFRLGLPLDAPLTAS